MTLQQRFEEFKAARNLKLYYFGLFRDRVTMGCADVIRHKLGDRHDVDFIVRKAYKVTKLSQDPGSIYWFSRGATMYEDSRYKLSKAEAKKGLAADIRSSLNNHLQTIQDVKAAIKQSNQALKDLELL